MISVAVSVDVPNLSDGVRFCPSSHTKETRHYRRHWTPVHMDLHVDNLKSALARAIEAGAKQEQLFENPEHGSVAFCSDPFGHGFCLIERRRK